MIFTKNPAKTLMIHLPGVITPATNTASLTGLSGHVISSFLPGFRIWDLGFGFFHYSSPGSGDATFLYSFIP